MNQNHHLEKGVSSKTTDMEVIPGNTSVIFTHWNQQNYSKRDGSTIENLLCSDNSQIVENVEYFKNPW